MPYIKQEFRQHYDDTLNKIQMIGTKGDLEYCIFKLMLMYMNHRENGRKPTERAICERF